MCMRVRRLCGKAVLHYSRDTGLAVVAILDPPWLRDMSNCNGLPRTHR